MSDRPRRVADRDSTGRRHGPSGPPGRFALMCVRASGLRRRRSGVPAVRLPGPSAKVARSWTCGPDVCLSSLSRPRDSFVARGLSRRKAQRSSQGARSPTTGTACLSLEQARAVVSVTDRDGKSDSGRGTASASPCYCDASHISSDVDPGRTRHGQRPDVTPGNRSRHSSPLRTSTRGRATPGPGKAGGRG